MSFAWTDATLGYEKSFPTSAVGLTSDEFVAAGLTTDAFDTPLLLLDRPAIRHNIDLLASWAERAGISLQPHAKTTMAPALWQWQLDRGAVGLTVATVSQARIAHWAGVPRIQIANELTSAGQVADVVRMNASDVEVAVWADSLAAVDLLADALGSEPGVLPVFVELGSPGGRAGARSIEDAVAVAERAATVSGLAFRGVAGYEGAVAHSRSAVDLRAVDEYLDRLAELSVRVAHLVPGAGTISIGGSIYFDRAAERLRDRIADGVEVVVRSGASILHDHGIYERISPMSRTNLGDVDDSAAFQPAARGYGRVHAVPEPGTVIVEGGKRDFAYDEGLPVPLRSRSASGTWTPFVGQSVVSATNDQHLFLATDQRLNVGDLVEFGLSHPCTIMDKWRWIPLVDHWPSDGADAAVVGVVRTWF